MQTVWCKQASLLQKESAQKQIPASPGDRITNGGGDKKNKAMEEARHRQTAPQAEASNANHGYKDGQTFPGQVA